MSDPFAAGAPPVVGRVEAGATVDADIAIIGAGMGGATLAWALRESGARVLVVERGDFLPAEEENWSPTEVFARGRYKNAEPWYEASTGKPFTPGVHYYVGGNTKVYGACLPRFREDDFTDVVHHDGVSPGWPFSYSDMEPFYGQAESLYRVHGEKGHDPTEPWRSTDYPFPALQHEPSIQRLADSLADQGLRPFPMPMGVDVRPGGACVVCRTCDGYPCRVEAKSDADVCALRPALRSPSVRLLTRTTVTRLLASASGAAVTEAVAERDGRPVTITARRFVLACGAVNSAAVLLRSANDRHPSGLANSSGQLGRNYMVHNSTFLVAVDPRRTNTVTFQKTLGVNDWYRSQSGSAYPLGNLQMLGKLQGSMIKPERRWVPVGLLDYMTRHSVDIYLTTEDLPRPDNRVTLDAAGRIVVHWTPNNLAPHRDLVRRASRAMRRAGFPFVFTQRMGIATNSHQCGTAVMGADAARSVLTPGCRAHDLDNLWVVDSSCFPSSTALNPALTIAANALRVAADGALAR